jgi:hypothetical protein
MDGGNLVASLQVKGNKGVSTLNPVNKAGAPLYHPLVD